MACQLDDRSRETSMRTLACRPLLIALVLVSFAGFA